MLERVAVHQTRLRTPGLGLDGKGVALGAKGMVLLPSLDRLVAFLGLFTRQSSLAEILRTLSVEVVRSKLGAREITLTFAAESSDRMDHVAEVARLAGGYTFTGTSRHFVQYRDAGAPFGYDVPNILPADAPLVVYHTAFSQSYELERPLELRSLLLRLQPHTDPSAGREPGPRWIAAEAGLGAALIHYFVRSGVEAEVGLAEWPPATSFDDAPVKRYLFRLPAVPARMIPLLTGTPGITVFVPASTGAAVEVGFRHPVHLRACPVFAETELVLFRGGGREPLVVTRLPALGDVASFARFEVAENDPAPGVAAQGKGAGTMSVPLRIVPTSEPWKHVTASWIPSAELALLRRLAYALGPDTLRKARVAFTSGGAFLHHPGGIEGIPVGEFYREIHPGLHVPAGHEPVPAVSPEVLFRALGAPPAHMIFLSRDGRKMGVPTEAFVTLETALLEAQDWAPLGASSTELTSALATELPEIFFESAGLRPLRDIDRAEPDAPPAGAGSAGS